MSRAIVVTCVERFTCWRCFLPCETRVPYSTKGDIEIVCNIETPRYCPSCIARDLAEQARERARRFGEAPNAHP